MAKSQADAPSPSEHIDRKLASDALSKMKRSEVPNARESSALKRIEKDREEKLRWQYYRSIPKKHWQEMSGRQIKVINEQGERYNLHLAERQIDLPKFVRAFHDFLAANSVKLSTETDPLLAAGGDSVGLERYRTARASQEEIKLEQMRLNYIPRDEVEQGLIDFSRHVRRAGDTLERQFGHEAAEVLLTALDDAERAWKDSTAANENRTSGDELPDADGGAIEADAPPNDSGVRGK